MFFIALLLALWFLAAFVIGGQMAKIWSLDFTKVGAMTIAQIYYASRRMIVVAFVAMVIMSWPLWLEVNSVDRVVFRGGKFVQVFNSGDVMLQGTWDKATTGMDVVELLGGEIAMGMEVEMQCPSDGALNGVLIITTDGENDRDSIIRRLEYCLKSGVSEDMRGYAPSIVKRVVGESSQFDMLCKGASKLYLEVKGGENDGTSRLKAKREVLEVAEKISEDLWFRFGIRIIDVDFRPATQ